MIQVQHLSKLYDDFLAVDNVDFELQAGQICGLVGPNGAGKTTTLRCLAGLIPATKGQLRVAGHDVETEPMEVKRALAYVPDDPPLFDDLSVGQHLDFIGKLYQIDNHVEKSKQLLVDFDLTQKINAGASTLSRGMRQKLAISCAYLIDPKVLLLDEPLTGLDPPGIRRLLASVQQRAATGTSVIISSHLLAMIEDICTHLLVMQDGAVQYFGQAAELRQQYPQAKSLEQAFFAATRDQQENGQIPNLFPTTIPIDSFLSGVGS